MYFSAKNASASSLGRATPLKSSSTTMKPICAYRNVCKRTSFAFHRSFPARKMESTITASNFLCIPSDSIRSKAVFSFGSFFLSLYFSEIFHPWFLAYSWICIWIEGKNPKKRDICYASHTDRCLLQYYCHQMDAIYNSRIREYQIEDVPVAYRSDLGLNNIHLAKIAFDFIKDNPSCYVMIGDFTSFFDKLDHAYLKQQWCQLLGMQQLPPDHYNIFKNVTRYSVWELDDLLELNDLPKTNSGRTVSRL